jgi:hypothetical protein
MVEAPSGPRGKMRIFETARVGIPGPHKAYTRELSRSAEESAGYLDA